MKILVLTDRFVPEITAPSFRILDHARIWLEAGHEVTVVTCVPNFPRGVVFPGYRNRLYQEESLEGIRVVRLWSYLAANEGVIRRSVDYLSFMVSSILMTPRLPEFDVLLATSPPILTPIAGWVIARLRRRPWVFEIRDLWPASIGAVGVSKGRVLRLLERIELFLYRRADRIVSLTHSFRRNLAERGIPAEKNDVVTNGVDTREFSRARISFDARARLGVPREAFLAGYVGTTGLAHGLETIVDAADLCRGDRSLYVLILGEGARRRELEADAKRRGLSNLIFRDFVPHAEVPSYLGALDASIVHLRPDPVFRTVIPSKIFESMAMGIPIVLGVEGESAEIVRDSGAGVCIPPGDANALAETLRSLAASPETRQAMSEAGRKAAEERYGRRANGLAALRSLEAAMPMRSEGGR